MEIKGFKIINGMAVPEDSVLLYKKNKIFQNAGIPKEYWDMSIENFTINQDSSGNDLSEADQRQKAKVFSLVSEYVAHLDDILFEGGDICYNAMGAKAICSNSLILKGDGGSGKTLLSVIIMKAAIDVSPNVCFVSWNELYDIMSDFDNKAGADDLEKRLVSADLAIIDGITNHAYRSNTFFQRKMEYIFSHRLGNKKPVIWTSYIGGHDLCEMFGPSVQSFIKYAIIARLPNGNTRDAFKEI